MRRCDEVIVQPLVRTYTADGVPVAEDARPAVRVFVTALADVGARVAELNAQLAVEEGAEGADG